MGVHSCRVKRWQYLVLAIAVLAVAAYLYVQHGTALGSLLTAGDGGPGTAGAWHTIERPGDGFKVDMPGQDKELQAPAYNETGGSEQVHMLVANPGGNITYAVTWQDNPPVARDAHSVDHTLYMARDGMLARTETTIVSEMRGNFHDRPSLDVLSRNNSGGILNARLIMAEDRLYMLLALFPSSSARRDKDVDRFFNSFVPAHPSGIPETIPAASSQ